MSERSRLVELKHEEELLFEDFFASQALQAVGHNRRQTHLSFSEPYVVDLFPSSTSPSSLALHFELRPRYEEEREHEYKLSLSEAFLHLSLLPTSSDLNSPPDVESDARQVDDVTLELSTENPSKFDEEEDARPFSASSSISSISSVESKEDLEEAVESETSRVTVRLVFANDCEVVDKSMYLDTLEGLDIADDMKLRDLVLVRTMS